jgi:UDP-N-acetylmuramoyl-tripeptide--D-alanyl-D-alanine ligase
MRARITSEGPSTSPERAVVDSRGINEGELFFGLPGENTDGARFAAAALEEGAWGVVVPPGANGLPTDTATGWVFEAERPLEALQLLARAWRRELDATVVGITGSTGKTSVKDICHAILPARVHASRENYNTEIGLSLAVLEAGAEVEILVLEMGMRGVGQIAQLCKIAEPNVAAITNVGPVHLELLGTLDAIVEAKAEILAGLGDRGRAVVPEDAEALGPHLHDTLVTMTFGPGGDVFDLGDKVTKRERRVMIGTPHGQAEFRLPFTEAHNLSNTLCAVAIGTVLDLPIEAMAERAPGIVFSRLRGQLVELADDVVLVNDCYNANPISMRAALEHLATLKPAGRRVAVLGGMAELGPDAAVYHREAGALARELGIGPIVGVGELARDYAPDAWAPDAEAAAPAVMRLLGPGDTVLIKGSRAIELERLTDELAARRGGDRE